MTTTNLNNFNHDCTDFTELTTYKAKEQSKVPFMNWWWCATIVGALPCIVTNLLFSKEPMKLSRVQLPSVTSMSNEMTRVDMTEVALHPLPIGGQNYQRVPLNAIPISHDLKITTDITHKNPEDFVHRHFDLNKHAYMNDVIDDYTWHRNHDEIPSNILDQKNNDVVQGILANEYLDVEHITGNVHIPTVIVACKELTGMLEDTIRHFKVTTNRRLARSERNYWFGRYVLPRVINHLNNDVKFVVDGDNIQITAQEIIYRFFENSGRCLPHQHILTEYDTADIDELHRRCLKPVIWHDYHHVPWEVKSVFWDEKCVALGNFLFQFPSQELNTSTLQQ